MRFARASVALTIFVLACRDPGRDAARRPAPASGSPSAELEGGASVDADSRASVDGGRLAEAKDGAAAGLRDYFDFDVQPHDIQNANRLTFEALAADTVLPVADAVVLCRVGIIEPAPLPKSGWDRANGRDLAVEVIVDDKPTRLVQGPLGFKTFVVRAEHDLRDAAAGKKVRWALRDRDEQSASRYESSVVVGELDLPADAKLPFRAATKTMNVDCRGATRDTAVRALLPAADRALDDSEKKLAWKADDPRPKFFVRDAVNPAAEAVRHAGIFGNSLNMRDEAARREQRLRDLVLGYLARAKQDFDKLDPTPVGTWAQVGSTLSVRVVETICPALKKGDDPGSLNDWQREGCALVLEMKSLGAARIRWNVDPYGPAYACRDMGPLEIVKLVGPADVTQGCVVGVRRGAAWQKQWAELSPTEVTKVLLGGGDFNRALRISTKGAAAWLAVPPPVVSDAGDGEAH